MSKPLKVLVTLSITIENPDDWVMVYGIEPGRANVRNHVKGHMLNAAQNIAPFNGEVEAEIRLMN